MVHPLWQQFPSINKQLTQLNDYLTTLVQSHNPDIDTQINQLLTNGGKFLRPGLFLLCAQLGPDQNPQRRQSMAAAIELLHVATLIHDDVLDNADQRHNQPTIQVQQGNRTAIYAGDFLFTSYFSEVLKAAETRAQIQSANAIMRIILTGELNQLALNFDVSTTIDAYLNEIKGKTAQLFAFAMVAGVESSHGSQKNINQVKKIGLSLGMAYQIRDDILDFVADPTQATKPVRHDLREGVYTLPLLLASKKNPDWFTMRLSQPQKLSQQDLATISQRVIELNGPREAEAIAKRYTDEALQTASLLPQPVGDQLSTLIRQLLIRND